MHNKTLQIGILLYLLLSFSIPSTLGILKRGTDVSGTIRVAGWNVGLNQNGVNGSMQLTPNGAAGSYTLNVVSNSDVDVKYSIVVRNIPSGVQVKLDEGSFESPSNGTYRFDNAGTILYGANPNENTHTLYLKALTGATVVNNQTVSVDVEFIQKTQN